MILLAAAACCVIAGGCQIDAEGEGRVGQMKRESRDVSVYRPRVETLPAFDVTGFTKIVASGGEQYEAVRSDGRWEVLRASGGGGQTIYGVASHDPAAGEGRYRYTVGVKGTLEEVQRGGLTGDLFALHIPASQWVVFTLENFAAQYGRFWGDDPYQLIADLGWDFNHEVGMHIDVYAPSYVTDDQGMEFWMPVKQRG
jgi:predicted transcriptional regulator YdeE